MEIDDILNVAVKGGASDVVLKTGSIPRFRFNGDLHNLSEAPMISPAMMQSWIDQILPPHLASSLQTSGDADFAYQDKIGHRFRVNLFRQRQSYGLVLRVISNHIKTMEELQLPQILKSIAQNKRGLILVTGATGSGKSTTLAAMIQKINLERSSHIITIEDPIEFNFQDGRSTIQQREIGIDTQSFGGALRASLRQNPDVIMVGELRDRETTETALMAAETGHLVMSTLHTSDAVESLNRLLSYFEPHQHSNLRQVMAHSICAVISQRLVSKLDGKGMAAAHEILINTVGVKELILNGSDFTPIHDIIANGSSSYGMQTFDQSLIQLYQSGVITKTEALAQASNQANMELAMTGVSA